jgi:hypothetical protein
MYRFLLLIIFVPAFISCEKNGWIEPPVFEEPPSVAGPKISSFDPDSAVTGSVLHITGKNFNPDTVLTTVFLGAYKAKIRTATSHDLSVTVPRQLLTGPVKITVNSYDKSDVAVEEFNVISPWREIFSFTLDIFNQPNILTSQDYAYILNPHYDESQEWSYVFWRFNPDNNEWTNLGNFPGVYRCNIVTFLINDKIYAGLGSPCGSPEDSIRDFWEYDISLAKWTKKASFPEDLMSDMMGFQSEGMGYVLNAGSQSTYIWQYNPQTDAWAYKNHLDHSVSSFTTTMDGITYFCTGYIQIFNPEISDFENITDEYHNCMPFFGINGYLFLYDFEKKVLLRFNTSTRTFDNNQVQLPFNYDLWNFGLKGKGYCILSAQNRFIQFDPSLY